MDPENLNTTAEVMEALGGTAAVAELTGRQVSAASNWLKFPTFPSNTYVAMKAALTLKGKTAPDSLWSMSVPSEKESAA